jgi:hypothetical protein
VTSPNGASSGARLMSSAATAANTSFTAWIMAGSATL